MEPQKLIHTTEVACGLQKFSKFSQKRVKPLIIFFYFPEFFLAILLRPNRASLSSGWVQIM